MNNPKKALVTGGAGFIGSNFISYLQDQDPEIEIINLDLLTYAGSPENLVDLPDTERHHFVQGDICDREAVDHIFAEHKIDLVVHFAAESHVDRSILGPEVFIRTNIHGTFILLEAARKAWIDVEGNVKDGVRFHHISTDEVYGTLEPDDPPFSEKTLLAPSSPYSASKAASDHLVRAYFHTYGLPISITNCSNNYGPKQFPEKLIPLMILNAQAGKSLPIYGDGKQIRDWLYVEDHCRAIWQVINQAPTGETYNIGGDNQPTNLEIVKTICEVLDALLPNSEFIPHHNLIQHVKDRPGHDRRYAMNIQKVTKDVGWKPEISLEAGIKKTVSWYLEHPEWVKRVQNKGSYQDWVKENYLERETK